MKSKRFVKANLFKGLRIFLFITFLAVTLILVFTVSKETKEELKLISPLFIVLTLFSTFLSYLFNIWRLRYIIKALGKEISWSGAFYYTVGGMFLGGITPLQVGGVPLQLYICRREDITIPEASAAIFTRGLLSIFVLPLLAPRNGCCQRALDPPHPAFLAHEDVEPGLPLFPGHEMAWHRNGFLRPCHDGSKTDLPAGPLWGLGRMERA